MNVDFDILSCIILPSVGFCVMTIMKSRANIAIQNKTFSFGMYRFKPVYGDRVIPVARGYKRSGVIIFIVTILLPAAMLLIRFLQ